MIDANEPSKWARLMLERLRENEDYRARYFHALDDGRIPPRA